MKGLPPISATATGKNHCTELNNELYYELNGRPHWLAWLQYEKATKMQLKTIGYTFFMKQLGYMIKMITAEAILQFCALPRELSNSAKIVFGFS